MEEKLEGLRKDERKEEGRKRGVRWNMKRKQENRKKGKKSCMY